MHITLEADYAVRIVTCIANSDKRLDAKTISAQTSVTIRFALKILRKLVSSGIVKSFKGNSGGYELAKPPSEITLRAVIETVEGTYCFSRCLNDEEQYTCNRTCDGKCAYQKAFHDISETVRDKMEQYTFDMFLNNKTECIRHND